MAVQRVGRAVAALAAGRRITHGASWRLLLSAGAPRVPHHIAQHELLQQQELVNITYTLSVRL